MAIVFDDLLAKGVRAAKFLQGLIAQGRGIEIEPELLGLLLID